MALEHIVSHQHLSLQEKVALLTRPEVYPEATGWVESRETHMSWVFLTDRFVYKMKKPVRYDFLDYSTLMARKHFCFEEIRLNRRLAEGVYLDAVPLTVDPAGIPHLGGSGPVAEWLVKMKRLPRDQMLDAAIARHTVTPDKIRAVIGRLVRFYREAAPIAMGAEHYLARLNKRIDENRRELDLPQSGLPVGQIARIHAVQKELLAAAPEIFAARAADGRIVEAHGDLRPEHVCLGPEPVIIDCLEFERDFRILDPVEELAFLAMECALLGAPEIGRFIFKVYGEEADETPSPALIGYYQSYRACVRAMISLRHIAEVNAHDAEYWRSRARVYLDLAGRYLPLFTPKGISFV